MRLPILMLLASMLVGCGPKKLHVVDPHCTTNEQGYTLCLK